MGYDILNKYNESASEFNRVRGMMLELQFWRPLHLVLAAELFKQQQFELNRAKSAISEMSIRLGKSSDYSS